MTPQLQQAIKLLQMSNLELAEYVATELERNPLLEREDSERAPAELSIGEMDGADPADGEVRDSGNQANSERIATDEAAPETAAQALDVDYYNDWQEARPGSSESEGGGPSLP